jgi:acetyl-CoA synthetase
MSADPKSNEVSNIYKDIARDKISLQGKRYNMLRKNALEDPERFWDQQARNLVWFKYWDRTLTWDPPFAKWFTGGSLNASVNCIDRHVDSQFKNKAAIIWQGENEKETRTITYYQLFKDINIFANALKSLGVKKGDRVIIYLPMVPEVTIAMLACARIGATHIVVFSGFSAKALADRANDSESKIIITADGGYRRGKIIELKKIVNEAASLIPSLEKVVVLKRASNDIEMTNNRDVWWHEIVQNEQVQQQQYCEPEVLASTHPLFILYTSGTTGKPKGVLHSTGGYLTHLYATAKLVFDFRSTDIFFCTADVGWVTGHSYMVYAPLMHGITEIMYEGTPDYPTPDRYWAIVEKHGATILYTTPTALRMYIKHGDNIPKSFDLSSLRLLGTVGESINPDVWQWYFKTIGKGNCPIIDTWWQTETGGVMLSACTGVNDDTIPMKPGSATFPVLGVDMVIVDEHGEVLDANKKGYLTIKNPWPGMLMTLWKNDKKYHDVYWSKFKGMYYTGDYALMDEDGYFWLLGRSDDVLKVAGHRLSTMELESTFVSHKAVAEAAVTGRIDQKKGESIIAFLVLRSEYVPTEELRRVLTDHIRKTIGPIAAPEGIYFVSKLPKTRSGKIMRRLLKSIANREDSIGDLTTLEDNTSVEEIKRVFNELKKEIVE